MYSSPVNGTLCFLPFSNIMILGGKENTQYVYSNCKKKAVQIMVGGGNRDSYIEIFKSLKNPALTSGLIYSLAMFVVNKIEYVRFGVFTVDTMKNGIFWDVTPCGSCKNRRFGVTQRLLHQG
jgi:hypothetical protein